MNYSLGQVEKTYRTWGRHPLLYTVACIITFFGREHTLRKRAVSMLELNKGDTALDIACGTGLNFPYLEEAVGPNGGIIALDYSKEMLDAAKQRAQKHNWKNITFIQGDAAQLSLHCTVDGALSTLGMSAIPAHKEALKKAFDILKENARISILDAHLPTGLLGIANPLIALVYKHWARWDYTKNIPEDVRKLFGGTKTTYYTGGTMYIASGIKSHMKSAYVFGPIHLFGQDYLPVYKHLMKLCESYFDTVIGTWPDFWDSEETPREFYDRTYRVITACDLFIGEVSSPSMGVGVEFQMAQEHDIPCIALCKKGVEPSKMIVGIPCTKKVVCYDDIADLSEQMNEILKDASQLIG